jgi:hypothetical protein
MSTKTAESSATLLAKRVLELDGELYVSGPDDDIGMIELDSKDWDRLVRLAKEALEEKK